MIFPVVIVFLLQLTALDAFAWSEGTPVTPYGDFCPQCGKYGTCNTIMTNYDAEKALKDYYDRKELEVEIQDAGERFIKARIHDAQGIVDIIIFDRRTGRIRSIY